MRHTVKFQTAILFAGTIALSTLSQPSKADTLTFDTDGNLINATGNVVRVTVDATGDVVDTAGNVVRVTSGTTGLILDPTTGVIRGTIDTTGNPVDTNGHVIVGTGDSRLVAVDRKTGIIIGTIDSNGHMVRSGGDKTSRVILVARNQANTNPEGLLLDPVSGIVRGRVDNSGRTVDLDGNTISARTFRGLLVIDPITKVVKGSIGQDGRLINLDLDAVNNNLIIAKNPSSYIMDPITGQVKGFIDTNGRWFDVTGSTMPAVSGNVYTVVDPTTRVFKGYVDGNGQVISSNPQIPDSYRRTTVVTSNENGQVSQTTTTTTTASPDTAASTFVLPARGTFVAVNPLTGQVKGTIDPATRTVNGVSVSSGYLVVDKSTGLVSAVVSPTGSFAAVSSVPVNDTFAASIDSQRVELSRLIANNVMTGQISEEQAVQLQIMLDRIPSSVEMNRFSYVEALPVIETLRSVRGQLVTVANIQPATPIVGWGLVTVNNELRWVDDIAFRRLELTRRIGDEFASRHIDSAQMTKLKNEIDRIAALENSYRSHDNGTFTNQESRALYVDYDRVAEDLEHYAAAYRRKTVGSR